MAKHDEPGMRRLPATSLRYIGVCNGDNARRAALRSVVAFARGLEGDQRSGTRVGCSVFERCLLV